jgi:signal transduction histidine kinase
MIKSATSTHTISEAAARTPDAIPWTRWIAPRPFDWVCGFLYLSVGALFVIRHLSMLQSGTFPLAQALGLVGAIAALLAVDRWGWRRYGAVAPPRIAALLIALRFALIETVTQIDGFGLSVFLYVIIPFTAALAFGSALGWALGGGVWALFVAKLTWFKPQWYLQDATVTNVIVFTMTVIFVLAMAKLVIAERAGRLRTETLFTDLQQSHTQLTTYAAQVEALATTAERNRLAREIHDSLGHYLTVINVQLEKALAFRDKAPQQADQAVRDSKRLAHEALEDVRRSVGILRASAEAFSIRDALGELIEPLRDTLAISLTVTGDEQGFSRPVLMALYRGAQEGLTNIQRHAQAQRVDLSVTFTADEARLTLTDDGAGFDVDLLHNLPPGRLDRYGLQGLQERLELIGGRLVIASRPGIGTTLTIIAPKGS